MGISEWLQVDVFKQQPLPSAESLSAVVITGSPAMVSERQAWSEQTAEWLVSAVDKNIPVLGVCYGHQLLAHALGGRVGANPKGRQIGTVKARLINNSAQDPLIGHLPQIFTAQTSHLEVVLQPPPNTERLATSPLDDNFALRFAENAWGLQFHPEFSGAVMTEYIQCRSDAIRNEGLDPEKLLSEVADTREARSVLRKFVRLQSA